MSEISVSGSAARGRPKNGGEGKALKKKAAAQAPPSQDKQSEEDMFPSPTASQQAKDALVQVATALKSGKGSSTGFADSDEEEEDTTVPMPQRKSVNKGSSSSVSGLSAAEEKTEDFGMEVKIETDAELWQAIIHHEVESAKHKTAAILSWGKMEFLRLSAKNMTAEQAISMGIEEEELKNIYKKAASQQKWFEYSLLEQNSELAPKGVNMNWRVYHKRVLLFDKICKETDNDNDCKINFVGFLEEHGQDAIFTPKFNNMFMNRMAGLDSIRKIEDSANQKLRKEKKIGKNKAATVAFKQIAKKKPPANLTMAAPPIRATRKKKSRAAQEAEQEDDHTDEELDDEEEQVEQGASASERPKKKSRGQLQQELAQKNWQLAMQSTKLASKDEELASKDEELAKSDRHLRRLRRVTLGDAPLGQSQVEMDFEMTQQEAYAPRISLFLPVSIS